MTPPPGAATAWAADRRRFDAYLAARNAIRTDADGFQWIDPDVVDADWLTTYGRWVSFGYATGLL